MLINRLTRFTIALLPAIAVFGVGGGCFSAASINNDSPPERQERNDGLPESRMVFLMPPDRWELLQRSKCEKEPAGDGCRNLFTRTANRLRWGVNAEDAPGLVVHACAQGHEPSCAAVELIRYQSLAGSQALAKVACPTPFKNEDCYAAAEILAYFCNERRQASPCSVLADLFENAEQPDLAWVGHYRKKACVYGGPCDLTTNVATRQP